VLDVREFHFQAVGVAAAVAEVHLSQAFGGDVAQLPLARAGLLGVEEAGRLLRGQGEGEVPDACVVGGAGSCGEAEAGAGVDDQPVVVAACFLASARMRGCQRWRTALCEVGAGPADLVLHVPLYGALRDAEGVGHGAGACDVPSSWQ
jgi:hypothetical protein